ncbi:MAG: tRNA (N(6)-L-threonylcarbamoyladenosine(37)-C(2))-methylthiotransferase MtaB [Opitutales bacterium]|nr:tRNA (N(6)-L-threonylcarbamoyladenosine(37)-C(2))-methylthiotransferase MtaB [Opitutales bacterium]
MYKKLAIYTLGCRVNAFESACIMDDARLAGFDIVNWSDYADIGIVNSCALTTLAEAKTRQSIRMFARKNPHSKIAVVGCYAHTSPEDVKKLENVEWVLSNDKKSTIVDVISESLGYDFIAVQNIELSAKGEHPLSDRMNLKIQDGCDNFCSYCIIPRARGLPRSLDFDKIIEDAKNLVSRGVRELVLTGINIAKFSTDKGGMVELIDKLNDIENLYRIRLGSIEPPFAQIDAVLERIKDCSHKLMPHLHISAQSLSDTVLVRMRRKHSAKDFLKMVQKCVERCPDISIGGDIICGHPAETRREFEITKNALINSGIAYMHVFTFSPRPKTLAWTMKDTPPTNERKARADELRQVVKEIRANFISSQVGKTRSVLLEHRLSSNTYFSHTDNYIPTIIKCSKENMKNTLLDVILQKGSSRESLFADYE